MMQLAFVLTILRRVFYGLLILWTLSLAMTAQANARDDYAMRFAKAQSLVKQGDDAAASKIYQDLIKQDPNQPQAYNNLAAIKARHGELQQAQALLEQALHSNPIYATVYENLSAIYVEMARDSYGKALHLETPQQAIALRELAEPKPAPIQIAAVPPKKTPAPVVPTLAKADVPAPVAARPQVVTKQVQASSPASTTVKTPEPAANTPLMQTDAPASEKTQAPAEAKIRIEVKPKPTPPVAVTQNITVAENAPLATAPEVKSPAPASQIAAKPMPLAINKEEVITSLQGWAAAWSAKAVDIYLGFYTDDYAPAGLTHAQWQAQRRARVQAPKWIQVSLSDFRVEAIKDNEARVRLIQQYKADNYRDRTRKEFHLRHTPDGWRIVEENTVAKMH